jgi:hypothetical protein
MWRTGVPIPHTSPPWVRLCRLAQHSSSVIRRKRKRAQARDAECLKELAPPRRPRLVTWRSQKKRKQSDADHRQQPVKSVDPTQSSSATTRLDDTRGGIVTLPDIRDRSGRGEAGPGDRGGMDARWGSGAHRGEGGHCQEAKARFCRYQTENNEHRAATSSNQRAPSERVEPFRGTSSVTHPPGRPPGLLVAAPEVARNADQPWL